MTQAIFALSPKPGLHWHQFTDPCTETCQIDEKMGFALGFAASVVPKDCECCLCVVYDGDDAKNHPPRHEPANRRQAARAAPAKPVPFRKAKERARYLLKDFSDTECREVASRMIDLAPEAACAAICDYWSDSIELARKGRPTT